MLYPPEVALRALRNLGSSAGEPGQGLRKQLARVGDLACRRRVDRHLRTVVGEVERRLLEQTGAEPFILMWIEVAIRRKNPSLPTRR